MSSASSMSDLWGAAESGNILRTYHRFLSRLYIFKSIGLANGLKWVKISLFHVLDVFSAKTSLSAY